MSQRWTRQVALASALTLLGSFVALVPATQGIGTTTAAAAVLPVQIPIATPNRAAPVQGLPSVSFEANTSVFFEANNGQFDSEVDYRTTVGAEEIYLVGGNAIIDRQRGASGQAVSMSWLGKSDDAPMISSQRTTGRTSYFVGDDPNGWVTGVASYGSITYTDIYPGIDVEYLGSESSFRYDLRVQPGADPGQIELSFDGADGVTVGPNGSLVVDRSIGPPLRFTRPVAFQLSGGIRVPVESDFALQANGSIGFKLGEYDPTLELVIDPTLEYSSYLGGADVDQLYDLAADPSGATYVVGAARVSYPTTIGVYQETVAASLDVVVTKLAADGQSMIYSTYIGGEADDIGYAIAVDGPGNVYIAGETSSDSYPTAGSPFDGTRDGLDAFVTKLSVDGSSLIYSTFLGGSNGERGDGIAVDVGGNAYVVGHTLSTDFPVQSPFDATLSGSQDAFITKLDAVGTGLMFSTYFGGSAVEDANDVVVDSSNQPWITGWTSSIDFPTTANTYKPSRGEASQDAFAVGFDAGGGTEIYGTYLGGTGTDQGNGIDIDNDGGIYLTGLAQTSFPATAGAWDSTFGSADDMFVAKLDPALVGAAELVYSGFIGGAGTDHGNDIAVDDKGRAHVVGQTTSAALATTDGFDQIQNATDGLVAIISADGATKMYATYVGGSANDVATGVSLDGGSIDVAGFTDSSDFPLLNAFDTVAASFEGWVARFTPLAPFVVNSTSDIVDLAIGDGICDTGNTVGPDPECTLRAAIQEANTSVTDEVVVPAGTYTLSIVGGGEDDAAKGDLDIKSALTITGAGAGATIIQAGTDATNGIDRVFDVIAPGPVLLSEVTIRHGQENDGAAVRTVVDLTLEDSVVAGNTASGSGGGFFVNGSIASLTIRRSTITGGVADDGGAIMVKDGAVTIENSTVSSNDAGRRGGGVYSEGGQVTITATTLSGNSVAGEDGGAVRALSGTVDITDSTISSNYADRRGGGVYSDGGAVTITGSTLSGNSTSSEDGGAIYLKGASAVVTNSTISGNTAGRDGGGMFSDGAASILNSTITANSAAGEGGGLYQKSNSFELQNSIVAGNTVGGNCSGTFLSLGNNLEDTNTCGFIQSGDQVGIDPLLGPLQDNGGPTSTHALLVSSPAIDAGNDIAAPATDQRGITRPQDGDGDTTPISDIGAFELEPVPLSNVTGTVFEDIAGDVLNDGVVGGTNNPGVANVDVYLYSDIDGDGIAEPTDPFISNTQTDANGVYTFAGLTNAKYFVVVDSQTVQPNAGIDTGNGWMATDVWAEQTYGPSVSECADGSGISINKLVAGPCYGGRRAGVSDDLTTWHSGAEHLGKVAISSADVANVDFGFSFNVITSVAGGDGQDDAVGNRTAQGTLRQFIWNANAITGPNASRFVPTDSSNDLGGGGSWWRIDISVVLPPISGPDTAVIGSAFDLSDGTTVLDPNPNGPELEIDGSALSADEDGFYIVAGADGGRLESAAVTNFPDDGVVINANNVSLVNSYIGVSPTGTTAAGNATEGIIVSLASTDTLIDGNVIGANGNAGITLNDSSTGTLITNNALGTDSTGSVNLGNGQGVWADTSGSAMVGGTNLADANTIAYNNWAAVELRNSGPGVSVLGNRIHGNGLLGIDTVDIGDPASGVTPPDSDDADTGPNDLLNYPVITAASEKSGTVTVDFDLDVPVGDYRIEVFTNPAGSDPTGYGEGEVFETASAISHLGAGLQSFQITYAGAGGDVVTLTTTEQSVGPVFGPTSEFSAAATVVVDAFFVNSTGDQSDNNPGDGTCYVGSLNSQGQQACTLRAAIQEANAFPGTDQIHFDMPTTESGHSGGIWTIRPTSQLPTVATTLTIAGSTQSGFSSTPVVELRGDLAGAGNDGLLITGDNVEVRSLAINRFTDDGIQVNSGAAGTVIAGNHIGTDPSGTVDLGNADKGIDLQSGSGPSTVGGTTVADRNVISGNGDDGIVIWESDNNVVIGNFIGTDVTGNSPLPNVMDGIALGGTSSNNIIGQPGAGNVLSGNGWDGIELAFDVTGNVLQANIIGLGADGNTIVSNARHGVVIYNGANATRVGGSGAGEGNVISANTVAGVIVDGNGNPATANNDIGGNLIGTDATGTLDRGNGSAGIYLLGRANANTIGGTAPADRNVISKNGDYGIRIDGPGTDTNIVAANYVGTDISGTVDLGNGTDGIAVRNGAQGNVIGGLSVGERNIIAGNDNDGVWITGSGTTDNIVRGNWVGYGADGSSLPNSYHGIAVENDAADNLIGGDVPAASNRIGNSAWDGVAVAGGTGSGNAILGNSIVDNSGLGIDLDNDGVTPNDGGDGDAGPNDLMNFPVITSATELAGAVTADYDIDVPAGSYRIEFFTNPSGSDPTGYGEGEVFVHADTIAHSGIGVEAFSTTFAGSAGQLITATATRILPGPTYSATSEFSQAVTIVPAIVAILSGSVLEDVDGDGDVGDDGVGTPGVEVSIYLDQGDGEPNLGDTPVTSTVTDASGDWSAQLNANGTYWIAVDSGDIGPAAGYNPSFGISDVWADQTFGSAGAVSYDGSSYSFAVSAGPLFGGMNASQPDGFGSIATAEHVHRVLVSGSDISGIDSGFSFQVVTNTGDDLDPTLHQGSLRQFIENSEAVSGLQTSQFVIPPADPGYSASPLFFKIRPVADLPVINDQATIDGTTQSEFAGAPIVELDGSLIGAGSSGLTINSASTSIRGLVVNRFGTGISVVGGADNVIVGNYLGPDVTGSIGQVGNIFQGLHIVNATGTIVGGMTPADRNVISGNRLRGVWIDDLSDGPGPATTGTLIVGNYIGTDASGTAGLAFDGSGAYQQIGLALWDGPGTIIGGAAAGESNVISGNDWYGIYIWGPNAIGNTVQGNVVGLDALASSAVGNGADEPTTGAGIYLSNAPGNLIGGTDAGDGNIISGNVGKGVIVHNGGAVGNSILGNKIHANNGIGIDLGIDGVTLNDLLDADTGANDALNFPRLSEATAAGGTVSLEVQLDVPAGDYRIEFFVNPSGADPSSYGEGETLRHSELIAHPGGGAQTYQVSFQGAIGDTISATTTELLAGPSYGSTSEFAQVEVVASNGDTFLDSSERRSDMTEVGTVDTLPGKAGIGARLSGAGERLVGPATDVASGELTLSAWVNATALGTDPRVVAKASSDGNPIYELLIDDATSEAVSRLDVGGSTVEVRGGLVGVGTWHQLLATWDGATITLYVDGVAVDSAGAVGALATDITVPLVVGNIATGTRSFNGTVDHVRVSHVARPQAWVSTTFSNIDDPGSFVTIGGVQTGVPGSWSASATTSRTGSFALAAPETVNGADAWATAIGLDEPGVEFEAWWQLSDPASVVAAAGTRTGAVATDQNETALSGSVFDLRSVVGSTSTQDAVSATGAATATWVKVIIRTDESGRSSVWIDDVLAIGPTLHSAGGPTGSVGLRVGELPSGETWHIDDVQLRRFVSDEPVATLGPLDRN